jgi:hypothetical protein
MENPTVTTSESIAQIAAALAKAQGTFHPVARNRKVKVQPKKREDGYLPPPYEFEYATLDSVIDSTREALSANGICHTAMIADGRIVVKLYHASGEWFSASVPVPPVNAGWQAFGSAITYARRYLLTPLLGVASEEDDDGNAADGNEVQGKRSGHDPLEPLWHALADKGISKEKEIREWIEMVLSKPTPTPDCITPAEATLLINVATGKAPMPSPTGLGKADAAKVNDTVAMAKELNGALNALAPWGKSIEGKDAKVAAAVKQAAKLKWANDMRPGAKAVAGFGELTADELAKLIAQAKAGEIPSMGAEDDMPPWSEKEMT